MDRVSETIEISFRSCTGTCNAHDKCLHVILSAGEVGRCLLSSTMGPAAALLGTRRHFAKKGFFGEGEEMQQLKVDIRAQVEVFLRAADVPLLRTKLHQLLKQNRKLLERQLRRASSNSTNTTLADQAVPKPVSKHRSRSSSRGNTRRRSRQKTSASPPARNSDERAQRKPSRLQSRSRSRSSSSAPRKGVTSGPNLPPGESIGIASENVKMAAAGAFGLIWFGLVWFGLV